MVSRIEPDRYADTGFAVKDTPPEVNARLFAAMMRRTSAERLLMCLDMMATGRALRNAEQRRARRGSLADLDDILATVPDVPPVSGDVK